MGFYSKEELQKIGFKSVGEHVLISEKCSFYDVENITIGDHVRIDDFCLLSGKITLGSYIHISAFSALYGRYGIRIGDYSGLSPRCTLFSAMDDFSGEFLINPMVPKELTNVTGGEIIIEKYCQLGSNTIAFPKLTIGEGAVTGAFSLINENLENWTVNVGIPCRFLKKRSKLCLQQKETFLREKK